MSLVDNITAVLTWPPSGTFSVPGAGLGPVRKDCSGPWGHGEHKPHSQPQVRQEPRARGAGAGGRSWEGILTATPATLLPPATKLLMTFQAQP